jgi:phosphocarrier protein HPr
MIQKKVVVKNKFGLHARAAAIFVNRASEFDSRIEIEKDGQVVDGKSIMGILTLAAARGTNLTIRAEGSDEKSALRSLSILFLKDFEQENNKVSGNEVH